VIGIDQWLVSFTLLSRDLYKKYYLTDAEVKFPFNWFPQRVGSCNPLRVMQAEMSFHSHGATV